MGEFNLPHILVVDDDPIQLEFYTAVLESDYDVIAAASLNEAIEILNTNTLVEALICDLHLGAGSNGKDLLAWISEHRPGLISRSMIISGNPTVDTGEHSVSVVMKPVALDDLLGRVSLLLKPPAKQTIKAR